MDILQTLGAAIVFGSALGATLAGFFAYRQKSLVTVLREANNDYKDRVEQLEQQRDSMVKDNKSLADRVKQLESEKRLPLEELTTLVIKQHTQQLDILHKIAEAMGGAQLKGKKR